MADLENFRSFIRKAMKINCVFSLKLYHSTPLWMFSRYVFKQLPCKHGVEVTLAQRFSDVKIFRSKVFLQGVQKRNIGLKWVKKLDLFLPNVPLLYSLKISENHGLLPCIQGVYIVKNREAKSSIIPIKESTISILFKILNHKGNIGKKKLTTEIITASFVASFWNQLVFF